MALVVALSLFQIIQVPEEKELCQVILIHLAALQSLPIPMPLYHNPLAHTPALCLELMETFLEPTFLIQEIGPSVQGPKAIAASSCCKGKDK